MCLLKANVLFIQMDFVATLIFLTSFLGITTWLSVFGMLCLSSVILEFKYKQDIGDKGT
jgi:hypothetical protein